MIEVERFKEQNDSKSLKNNKQIKEELEITLKALEDYRPWIPCSERLPDEYTEYLNGFHCVNPYKTSDYVEITYRNFNGDNNIGKDKLFNGKWDKFKKCEVIAWRELPKPYQESENE